MRLIDIVRQTAADAIILRQQQAGGVFLMQSTPVELLGAERAARARAMVKHVRDHETIDDVEEVALRIIPALVQLAASRQPSTGPAKPHE